jgi:hypothetical protein
MNQKEVLLTSWQWVAMAQFFMLLSNSMETLSLLWSLLHRVRLASCVILLLRTIQLSSGNCLLKKMGDLIHHQMLLRSRKDSDWKSTWLQVATNCERSIEVISFSSSKNSKWLTSMSWMKSFWIVAPPPTQSSSTYQSSILWWQLQLVTESSFQLQRDQLRTIYQLVAV